MKREQPRLHLPALGMATAIALAITFGVPLAMDQGARAGASAALAKANVRPATAEAATVELAPVEIVAVRERAHGPRGLMLLSSRRAS